LCSPVYINYSRRIGNYPMDIPGGEDIQVPQALAKQDSPGFYLNMIYKRKGVGAAFTSALHQTYFLSAVLLGAIPRLFTRNAINELTGPVGIIVAMRDIGKHTGLYQFIKFAALLNICIGLFNLLPIPALDGMRIIFLIIGAIRRKTVDQKIEGVVHFIGFGLLIILMIVVTYLDIAKLWRGDSIIPK